MIRHPETLLPEFRTKVEAWDAACAARHVDLLVYCTYRPPIEQAALYAQGRTTPGKIVTNAKPWQSAHQYRRAVDGVPLFGGKPVWVYSASDPNWKVFVEEAERLGLEWAGRWKTFKEYVHVQDLGGLTIAELYATEGPGKTA